MEAESEIGLTGVGIGVSDLARSTDFYINVIGMRKVRDIKLPHMEEVILSLAPGSLTKGSSVLLMHWTDGSQQRYANNPVKLMFDVPDAMAFGAKLKAAGTPFTREPAKSAMSNNIYGLAKDPDGYVIEFIQRVP